MEANKFMGRVVCEGWNATDQSGTQFLTNYDFEIFFPFFIHAICFLPFKIEPKAFKYCYIKTNSLITLK